MEKLAMCAGLLAVFAYPFAASANSATQSSMPKDASAVNLTGQVSCSRFGHGSVSARKGMSVSQTIQVCAQRYDYTLVSGKQIYRLTGDTNLLAKMSGKTVTLEGRFYPGAPEEASYVLPGTVAVTSISPTKN